MIFCIELILFMLRKFLEDRDGTIGMLWCINYLTSSRIINIHTGRACFSFEKSFLFSCDLCHCSRRCRGCSCFRSRLEYCILRWLVRCVHGFKACLESLHILLNLPIKLFLHFLVLLIFRIFFVVLFFFVIDLLLLPLLLISHIYI